MSAEFAPQVENLENGNLSIVVSGSHIEDVNAIVERFNRRAAREGIEERVEIISNVAAVREDEDGLIKVREIEVSIPVLKKSGWSMVAALDFVDSGVIVRAVPGESLEGWERPESVWCDHCQQSRERNRSFVVRSDDGEIKQVGSSCLTAFIGFSPAWAFHYVGFEEALREEVGGFTGGAERIWSIENVLRIAHAVTDGGRHYVRAGSYDETPTGQQVLKVLTFTRGYGRNREQEEAEIREIRESAEQVPGEVIEEIIECGRGLKGDGDYVTNLRVLLAGEHVGFRHVALLGSLLSVWAREKSIAAERAATPVLDEWLGEVKVRLRDLKVHVTKVVYLEGNYGTTTLLVLRDEDGRSLKWFASGAKDLNAGDVIILDGTVKAHETYEGRKQTALTRCKIKEVVAA